MRRMILAALLGATAAFPAMAQDAPIGQRVDRLEKEMRAVQRKVFPGAGTQQYLEPEIAPQITPPETGVPASSPVADLTARVNSLEEEVSRVTSQVETANFKLRQLEESFKRFQDNTEARLSALEGHAPAPMQGAAPPPPRGRSSDAGGPPPADAAAPDFPFRNPSPTPDRAPPSDRAPSSADAAAGLPPSSDPAEDAYLAGYRLWDQKKYAEAEAALRAVVAKYPNHRRASYAQNLLGRALLDDGQPAKAAKEFYSNYQIMPRGERAPDSLYYLGQSLTALKPAKTADACKVYGELMDVYGEKISDALKAKVAKGQADAKCAK